MKKTSSLETAPIVGARAMQVTVPDGGWGWLVCLACWVGWFLIGGKTKCFGIILPSLKEYFHQNTAVISMIGTLGIGLCGVLGPFVSCLINRFGLRAVYMAGSTLTAISLFASTFSHNAFVLLVTYGIFTGIGLSLIMLPISIGCNYYFDKKISLATGISKTGTCVGGIILPPLVGVILEAFDWKAVVYSFASIAISSGIFAALIRPLEMAQTKSDKENVTTFDDCKMILDSVNPKSDETDTRRHVVEDTDISKQKRIHQRLVRSIDLDFWNDPAVLFFLSSRFFGNLSSATFKMFLPVILVQHQFSMVQASIIVAVDGVLNMFSCFIFGAIMDHPRVDCLVSNAISFVNNAIFLCIFTFYDNLTVLIIVVGLMPIFNAPFQVNTSIVLGEMLPKEKLASAFGNVSLTIGIAGVIGPVGAGYIFDQTKDYRVIVFLEALGFFLSGVACLMTYFLNGRRPKVDIYTKF